MGVLSRDQWDQIQATWISSIESTTAIAARFGVNEKAIRKRAIKEAWGERNAPARKRAIVAARLSGTNPTGSAPGPCSESEPRTLDAAVEEAVEDMRLGTRVARKILQRCEAILDHAKAEEDAAGPEKAAKTSIPIPQLKQLAEASRTAVETIRRCGGLDDPGGGGDSEVVIDWGGVVGRR